MPIRLILISFSFLFSIHLHAKVPACRYQFSFFAHLVDSAPRFNGNSPLMSFWPAIQEMTKKKEYELFKTTLNHSTVFFMIHKSEYIEGWPFPKNGIPTFIGFRSESSGHVHILKSLYSWLRFHYPDGGRIELELLPANSHRLTPSLTLEYLFTDYNSNDRMRIYKSNSF